MQLLPLSGVGCAGLVVGIAANAGPAVRASIIAATANTKSMRLIDATSVVFVVRKGRLILLTTSTLFSVSISPTVSA